MKMTENQIKEAFHEIKADDTLKQQTLKAIFSKQTKKRPSLTKLVLTTALLLIAGVGGIFSYTVPVYAISLDEDASIELYVNMYQKVVSVTTYDTTLTTSVNNLGYTEAVTSILDSNQFSYKNVVITVAGNDQEGCQKMIQNLQHCNQNCMANASYNTVANEMIAQAKECDMSLGKYNIYLMLKETDPTITLEEAQNMTMQEMHQRMGKGMGKMMTQSN
jgi:hypothetical protein